MNKSVLKVKVLRENVKMPKRGSELASGFDVRAYSCYNPVEKKDIKLESVDGQYGWTIKPNETLIFKTGLVMACGEDEEIQVRPRSGISCKTKLRIANTPGTIDADYRGEIGIIIDNIGTTEAFVPYEERIAQIVVCPVIRPEIVEVEELDDTDRGANGYGSTGTK